MSLKQAKTQSVVPRFGRLDADLAEVQSAIVRSREYLLSRQHPDGYWCGELEGDSMLEADYIYLHTQLESGDPGRLKRALTESLSRWAWQHLAFGKVLFFRKAHGNRGE